MLLTSSASGVFPIAPSPFLPTGEVDWKSAEKLFAYYNEIGANGATVLGIMGEAPKLEAEEAIKLVEIAVKALKNKPIIVGVSAAGFAAMRSLTKKVMDKGAGAVMIAPPNHLRTDDQITGYYAQAIEAIGDDIPFIIQDYPLTLSVVMTPNVIKTIVNAHKSCVMLKHEDWPGLDKISTLRGYQAKGEMRDIAILTGNGGLFLDFEMERGADGANTGYAFPEMLIEVVKLMKAGNRDKAHDIFDAHLPLLRYEQQPNLGLSVRKYVMMKRGIIAHDAQRKPGSLLNEKGRAEVDYLLNRLTEKLS